MEKQQKETFQRAGEKLRGFLKKNKKLLLITSIIALVIVLACTLPGAIYNAVLTNKVQAQLSGKIFICENGIWISAYCFDGNTFAEESWCTKDHSTWGDINKWKQYKVTGKNGSSEIDLREKEDGKWKLAESAVLCDDGTVSFKFGEWRLATMEEINTTRKQVLCEHVFGEPTTIKEATCASGGETSSICINCGYLKTQSTAALEHNYQNKICTECGAKKQPKKAYDIEANTWYTYQSILHFQNIKILSAFSVSQGKGMSVSYNFVCQHCHVIDETRRTNVPEYNYDIIKIFTCEECGGLTTVKIELG